jgi:hypothetical protein
MAALRLHIGRCWKVMIHLGAAGPIRDFCGAPNRGHDLFRSTYNSTS